MKNEEWFESVHLQNVITYTQTLDKRRLKAEKFIFSYLIKKGGKGNVYGLLLKQNGFDSSVYRFIKDIEFYTETMTFINVLTQHKNKATLELTLSGELFYKDKQKIEVKIPSYFLRLKSFIKNIFKTLWIWIKIFDKKVQKFWKSGIIIIIVYALGNLTKFDIFNTKSNNQEETQEIIDTNRKLKYFQTISDSLLKEIKQKEEIIKEYEQVVKDSILMSEIDSLGN